MPSQRSLAAGHGADARVDAVLADQEPTRQGQLLWTQLRRHPPPE